MVKRFLIVNYKAYPTAFNEKAIEIAREARKLSSELEKTRIILAVPSVIAGRIVDIYDDIFLQHVDPVGYGAFTGFLPASSLEYLPVRGTLVNHSEHKIIYRDISRIINTIKNIGKEVIVCADTPSEAAGIAYLNPDMIAIEPPELIGTGIPVSKAKPEVITNGVKAVHSINPNIPVLAGAGISNPEDAVRALELGASGILVASVVMKASDPRTALRNLALALEK